jgi:hypothetical protein
MRLDKPQNWSESGGQNKFSAPLTSENTVVDEDRGEVSTDDHIPSIFLVLVS